MCDARDRGLEKLEDQKYNCLIMGEAKRRKQYSGLKYSQPLGLTNEMRINLIEKNIFGLISNHFEICGYHDYLSEPTNPQVRMNPNVNGDPNSMNLERVFDQVIDHWQRNFNQHYPRSAVKSLVDAILKDLPICLTENNLLVAGVLKPIKPLVTLPEARKYFRSLVAKNRVKLPQHYRLIQDVLEVLAAKTSEPLLRQLLWGEFNDVMVYASEQKLPWLATNLNSDGWIDLDDQVLFQAINCALAGILTTVATLPWFMQLEKLVQCQK
jgi:hypothetical protein